MFALLPRTARRTVMSPSRAITSLAESDVPNPFPASFLRGGTSKGIFIWSAYLPQDRSLWDPLFLRIMGSPDPYGRQLDGMGGGISSLSKICIVGSPEECYYKGAHVDVQYTFAQIGVKDATVDYSGNCGNLSSMIGVFAMDEGICHPHIISLSTDTTSLPSEDEQPLASVTSFNTNTNKLIKTTFPVDSDLHPTPVLDLPEFEMAGVPGKASRIILDFLDPSGARTGLLLPTGKPVVTLVLSTKGIGSMASIPVSLVDASNPTVFVHESDIKTLVKSTHLDYTSPSLLALLEDIRQGGASLMGLDPNAQAQPKIAVLSATSSADAFDSAEADIVVRALSMGVLHKAVPMTLGLCLGVAAGVPGTIPHQILSESKSSSAIKSSSGKHIFTTIAHPTGVVEVGAEFSSTGEVKSAKVLRTGKRLMRGAVYW